MDKCGHCANSRPVISENGWHFVCALHHTAARNCMLGKKEHFVSVIRGAEWRKVGADNG